MTLDELQSNPTLKIKVAKLTELEEFRIMLAVLDDEYRRLGHFGRTAGMAEADKIEAGGQVQGFNKCQHVIRQCLAVPRPAPQEVQSTYGANPVTTKSKKEKK